MKQPVSMTCAVARQPASPDQYAYPKLIRAGASWPPSHGPSPGWPHLQSPSLTPRPHLCINL